MRIIVIWNSNAGSAAQQNAVRQQLQQRPDVQWYETSTRDEAFAIARDADADVVVAAGGDGTVNTVINGLAQNDRDVQLAVLPLGTGNNLCRSLGIPLDPTLALRTVLEFDVRRIDLVSLRAGSAESRFANTASGGNADRVIDLLTPDIKASWGAWCYLRCALPVVADLRGYDVHIQFDREDDETFSIWNIIVANGRTAAGGLPVAPHASLEDGLMDVIIVRDGTPLDTAALATEFFLGDYLQDDRVIHRRAKHLRIDAQPRLRFLIDGEMRSGNPLEFAIVPQALSVVVGPDYDNDNVR